eukprot:1176987-Prorocentrum_minimum.AAC.2
MRGVTAPRSAPRRQWGGVVTAPRPARHRQWGGCCYDYGGGGYRGDGDGALPVAQRPRAALKLAHLRARVSGRILRLPHLRPHVPPIVALCRDRPGGVTLVQHALPWPNRGVTLM